MSLVWTDDGDMADATLIRERLVFGELCPPVLSKPVANAIRGLTDESNIREAVVRRLKFKGWAYPEAFFEERQVHCPATGNEIRRTPTHDDWCFEMADGYIITYDGGCHPQADSVFFGTGRSRVTDVTGWYPIDETTDIDGEMYPDWYADEHASRCPECDELTWQFHITDNGVCRACEAKNHDAEYLGGLAPAPFFVLAPYNDTSSVALRPQVRKPNRYGIELEICVDGVGQISNTARRRRIVATHAYHATKCFPDNYVVAKRDGSLYDCGFELVTKPDTYERMHKTLGESMPQFHPFLANGGECEGEDIEAGLHINMERRGKSLFHQAKILHFMFDPANEDFLVAVANRRSAHYAGFPGRARWNQIFHPPYNGGSSKYVAVHVKPKVLEFRLFSSFVSSKLVLSCLEFCEALVRFTEVTSARSLKCSEFIDFVLAANSKAEPVDSNPLAFPNLVERFHSPRFRYFLQNETTTK